MQKLIETLKSPEQVNMVITALTAGVVELIKDLNGNHVVQRCLQKLSHEDSQVSAGVWSTMLSMRNLESFCLSR